MQEENTNMNTEPVVVANTGNEYPTPEIPDPEPKPSLSEEQLQALKVKYPNSKFAMFYHVDDPYLYRSYTTRDLELLNAHRKEVEAKGGKELTDDEYLALFLNTFVCVPENCGTLHVNKNLSAGIPHLLYDLVNHLSGFAEVNPVVL